VIRLDGLLSLFDSAMPHAIDLREHIAKTLSVFSRKRAVRAYLISH
jgi:hypothetical protein